MHRASLPRANYNLRFYEYKVRSAAWRGWSAYTVKKVSGFPVPSRDVTYQTLPGREL